MEQRNEPVEDINSLYSSLSKIEDVWTRLLRAELPVVFYGTGNGTDKIANEFERRGGVVADYFASAGFVRSRTFRGKKVLSYDDVCNKYDDFIVVSAFGSARPEVIENLKKIASRRLTLAPAVPLYGRDIFDKDYFTDKKTDIVKAFNCFFDKESKKLFTDIMLFRLTGEVELLFNKTTSVAEGFKLLGAEKIEYAVDAGAYKGDTALQILRFCPNIKKILAIEPDKKSYKKLSELALRYPQIFPLNAAVWSDNGCCGICGDAGRGTFLTPENGGSEAMLIKIDDAALNFPHVDYIKYDVEGCEHPALLGSAGTIKKYKPSLLVSAYHKTDDLITLPLLIKETEPSYRLYLRKYECFPDFEINIYAV